MSTPLPPYRTPRPAVRRIATQTVDEMLEAAESGRLDAVLPPADEIREARERIVEARFGFKPR